MRPILRMAARNLRRRSAANLAVLLLLAVSARRRGVEIGRLSAIGGGPTDIVRLMVVEAGVLAAAAATGAGVALALTLLRPGWMDATLRSLNGHQSEIWGRSLSPWDVALSALLAVGTAVGAALLPAWAAARVDPHIARSGGADRRSPARWWPAAGLVLLGFSLLLVAVVADLSDSGGNGDLPAYVSAFAIFSLIAAVSLLVAASLSPRARLVGPLGSSGAVALRLAVRQIDRHRQRSVAVVTATGVLIGAMLFFTTMNLTDSGDRWSEALPGTNLALIPSDAAGVLWFDPAAPRSESVAVRIPGASTFEVGVVVDDDWTIIDDGPWYSIGRLDPARELWSVLGDGETEVALPERAGAQTLIHVAPAAALAVPVPVPVPVAVAVAVAVAVVVSVIVVELHGRSGGHPDPMDTYPGHGAVGSGGVGSGGGHVRLGPTGAVPPADLRDPARPAEPA